MADSPAITCPECRKKFKGKGNLQGKKIKCPVCAHIFVVPTEPREEAVKIAAMEPAPAPAAPLGFADDDEDEGPKSYGVTELDIAARCPNCAQLMADEKAFICLFCGYNTLTREIGATEKTLSHTPGERFAHLFPGIAVALTALGFIIGITYYSVVLPDRLYKTGFTWLDHESLRMWFTIITLGIVWGCGTYCYKRLIVHPTPPPKKKDK
jgi:hypothetical protein